MKAMFTVAMVLLCSPDQLMKTRMGADQDGALDFGFRADRSP